MGMKVNTPLPFETYRDLRLSIRQLYIQLPTWISRLSNSNVDYYLFYDMFSHLKNADTQWAAQLAVADIPALKTFAQGQHSDPAFDAQVEYVAVRNATRDAYNWIKANVPANSGIDQPPVELTPAQSAPLVTILNTLKAACE